MMGRVSELAGFSIRLLSRRSERQSMTRNSLVSGKVTYN